MRHKQRPVKSSRSITFVIDGHTSFGGDQHHSSNHHHHNLIRPILPTSNSTSTTSANAQKFQKAQQNNSNQQQQQRLQQQQSLQQTRKQHGATSLLPTTSSSIHNLNSITGNLVSSSAGRSLTSNIASNNNNNTTSRGSTSVGNNRQQVSSRNQAIINSSNDLINQRSTSNNNQPLMRKQFEHNIRHMSDVMRLAFLENNDISIDDCTNVDFNSLSTASILQRNIQQQLQQERREQLQFRQQQQQRLRQQQQLYQSANYADGVDGGDYYVEQDDYHHQNQYADDQDYGDNMANQDEEFDEDYEITDSRIFATAPYDTSTHQPSNATSHRSSTSGGQPKSLIRQQQKQQHKQIQQLHQRFQQQLQQQQMFEPSGSGSQQRVQVSGNKKKAKDSMASVTFSDQLIQVQARQKFGEGFFCDEPNCGKSFPSLRKLRHHKVVHSDEFPFVCEFNGCMKKFKRKFGIDLHSTTHFDLDPEMYTKTSNNSSLPFFGRRMQYSMCKPCGQKFKTVHEYQYHMLKHGKEPFKCPVKGCGQTFGIWKSFQKHRASHYFNYYCKMDGKCTHHTSNLQLLKLHIYCCHFKRKLPDNATLSSRDSAILENSMKEESIDVVEDDMMPEQSSQQDDTFNEDESFSHDLHIDHSIQDDRTEEDEEAEQSISVEDYQQAEHQQPAKSRRDSRLRKNPPRSSTFGHQDYASINNGSSFLVKQSSSTPQQRKTRATGSQQSVGSQSAPQLDKRAKSQTQQTTPTKILPKRGAQRLPMSLIATDEFSTEDDERQSGGEDDDEDDVSYTMEQDDDFVPSHHGSMQQRLQYSNQQIKMDALPRYGEGFFCDEPNCGKSFPSLRKLRHHKVVHSDEFPFVCEFNGCMKKFKRKFGIDLHSTTHFDLDPEMYTKTSNNSSLPFFGRRMQYSMCKPCGQKFKTVHEYQYHMLKHGKEPFKCPVKGCGQTFGIWKSFQKHRASHYFNYYCKMDGKCTHHTSNLQLLKLHIYCCHFKRKLPDNATLSCRDTSMLDNSAKDEPIDVVDDDMMPEQSSQLEDNNYNEDDSFSQDPKVEDDSAHDDEVDEQMDEEEIEIKIEPEQNISAEEPQQPEQEEPAQSRRDSRLRKNPPRSSTFGHDYASINNGSTCLKQQHSPSTPQNKRTRGSNRSHQPVGSQSAPPLEKKARTQIQTPTKVLPKRGAQRLPMSLIASDDFSTGECY